MKLMKVQIKEKQTELVEVPQAELEDGREAYRGGGVAAKLPSRGGGSPRTGGLRSPHGGFGFPARRVWVPRTGEMGALRRGALHLPGELYLGALAVEERAGDELVGMVGKGEPAKVVQVPGEHSPHKRLAADALHELA